jgi:aldose sugar dehydrogenase
MSIQISAPRPMRRLLVPILAAAACGGADNRPSRANACEQLDQGFGSVGQEPVHFERVAGGLTVPWAIGWLPGGDMLVTERVGRIRRITSAGEVRTIATVSLGASSQEGGLLGLALHPQVATNGQFYVYYTTVTAAGVRNQVERWKLAVDGNSAVPDGVIVADIPALQFHNGGRIRFGPDGYLYVGTGDAGIPASAQDPRSLAGKILRVTDNGEIPDDNPFPGSRAWILGVRNTQGFDWRQDGRMVMTDHGPSGLPAEAGRSGHDEINLVEAGDNLGWPTYYACEPGSPVVPSLTWADALPPGGTAIYTGSEIPAWLGDVLIGVLGVGGDIGHLNRVRIADDGKLQLVETYFLGAGLGRIREVAMGPDGSLYFTTSNCDGRGECGAGDGIYRVVAGAR